MERSTSRPVQISKAGCPLCLLVSTRSISMRQPTSMGPNSRIQRQFGAPHRDLPSWAQCRTYSSCGEPSAGVDASARRRRSAARVVVMVVASTANERRARIASINAHCGGSGQVWFLPNEKKVQMSLPAAFFTDLSFNPVGHKVSLHFISGKHYGIAQGGR